MSNSVSTADISLPAETLLPGRRPRLREEERVSVGAPPGAGAARATPPALERDGAKLEEVEHELVQAQKMGILCQLSSGFAHELMNLLTVILGSGRLLRAALPEGDPRHEDLSDLLSAAERAAGITRGILTFSKRHAPKVERVDVMELLADMEWVLGRSLGRDIALEIRGEPGSAPVMADRMELEQVFLNLALNAGEAMPEGGRLVFTVRDDAGEGGAGGFVEVEVRDTGAGMDEEIRRRVFEPFFTTKEEGKGIGLGLSTCLRVVERAGGTLTVESTPGVGTVFTLRLPRPPGA